MAGPAARPGGIRPVHRAPSTRRGIRVCRTVAARVAEGDDADRSSILGEAFGSDHVRISLRNDDGTPAAGIAFRARFRDGHIVNGTLDARGEATIADHTHGEVQVTFPAFLPRAADQLVRWLWRLDHESVLHRRSRRQPDGDRSALRAPGWRAIYDHPWNAAFRRRRRNPDLIHPGDILYIPDPNEATGTRSFDFIRRAVAAATIDIIEDTDNNHVVGATERPRPLVRIGLWDRAFNGGNVRNGVAEASNFIGRDSRRFDFRVRDPGAAGNTVTIEWRTLLANGSADDAPANAGLTLTQTAAGSHVFVSKAVMLVTNDLDAGQAANSGLTAAPRRRQSKSGAVESSTAPRPPRRDGSGDVPAERSRLAGPRDAPGVLPLSGRAASLAGARHQLRQRGDGRLHQRPVQRGQSRLERGRFADRPGRGDESCRSRRGHERRGTIRGQPRQSTRSRGHGGPVADHAGRHADGRVRQHERIERLRDRRSASQQCAREPLLHLHQSGLAAVGSTLAHEMHHVIFNRFDDPVSDEFISFNTTPTATIGTTRGIAIPDVRIRCRIHQHTTRRRIETSAPTTSRTGIGAPG